MSVPRDGCELSGGRELRRARRELSWCHGGSSGGARRAVVGCGSGAPHTALWLRKARPQGWGAPLCAAAAAALAARLSAVGRARRRTAAAAATKRARRRRGPVGGCGQSALTPWAASCCRGGWALRAERALRAPAAMDAESIAALATCGLVGEAALPIGDIHINGDVDVWYNSGGGSIALG